MVISTLFIVGAVCSILGLGVSVAVLVRGKTGE